MRSLAVLIAFAVVAAACSANAQSATTPGPGQVDEAEKVVTCIVSPPPDALEIEAALDVSIEPNPTQAGEEATLMVSSGLVDVLISQVAAWQCWDGSKWAGTHLLFAENPPRVLEVQPGATVAVAVGCCFSVGTGWSSVAVEHEHVKW
ncbi:MAG: hypothetical protein HKP18_11440 [Acidimicrobiia bacterium]|nr:hypothetical protein [Acidimicrobiia bacterium]